MTFLAREPKEFARYAQPVEDVDGFLVVTTAKLAREVAENPVIFSSVVSQHLQLPNGLDGKEHTQFRQLIDRYLSEEAMAGKQVAFQKSAHDVVAAAPLVCEAISVLGEPYAVKAMLAWLGWGKEFEQRLLDWVADNRAATRSGDAQRTSKVAQDFDQIIIDALASVDPTTVTAQLFADRSLGRALEFPEIVSILRNWTAGDLSSMAVCIGVLMHGLAENPAIQHRWRSGISSTEQAAIINEFLRIDDPFVANRRVARTKCTLGDKDVAVGQKILIHWTAANAEIGSSFDEVAHASQNLVWGAGPHACPGKALSLMELSIFISELLLRYQITLSGPRTREIHPVGGWATLGIEMQPI
ncbi:cytochrome P450 [Corynebacterium kutscheri]|uniref:cytochrome P450 n=1 Tax=Corynebacterium kutscheri TaxID=35755 RepID=UPI000F6CF078|nr:cytochrome P450 [Corynebacterium kutscheri]VEH80323.1 cytochrome P450 [Corynebacterium kutscheri]